MKPTIKPEWLGIVAEKLKNHVGAKNAVSATVIDSWIGAHYKGNNAHIRSLVHELRISGRVPLLCSNQTGYYIAKNHAEAADCVARLTHRLSKQTESRDALIMQMSGSGQLTLED